MPHDVADNSNDATPTGKKGSSIMRALTILEEVAVLGHPVTPTELNKELKLPKPTIHRLCATLEAAGFLKRALDGRRYTVGPRLRIMALSFLHTEEQQVLMRAVLERISKKVGETANISVPDQNRMQYIDRVETRWPLRVQFPVGSHVPLHCTSAGKMYLSSMRPAARSRLLQHLTLEKHAANTIIGVEDLEADLAEISARGYSTDNEEFIDGMVAVAVPVLDGDGRLLATLSIFAPAVRMSLDSAIGWVPDLRKAADDLTGVLTVTDEAFDTLEE
jgi:DNA-binding IclR family transcriptional regulator